ncbi:AsmA family protein [Falsochrobactrum sp. TDYN1]|uniref:AsmA family protein n=1 Tax=Falsochrobactrum tianjinense TaxID=2706015 RepID=A0A949USP3_9HYPH|nr:AsmA family protein [Falsochrobactrum sp. TDYN1]MBV2142919.1 AsmA family protein [Falsochrobactrum sp. TDYN1]
MKRIERLAEEGAAGVVQTPFRSRRSFLSLCSHAFLSLCIILILLGGAGFVVLREGVNSNLLRDEAQKGLIDILGPKASASIGSAALSLDGNSLVAMEAQDVSIFDPEQGIEIRNIESVRLGLAPLPLLTGTLRVAELEVDGATFDVPEQEGAGFWKSLPYDKRGFIDFDAVSEEIFAAMRRNLELLRDQNTQAIGLMNSTIRFKTGDTIQSLQVQKLRLLENSGKIAIEGAVVWNGKTIILSGNIDRKDQKNDLEAFQLDIRNIPVDLGSPEEVAPIIGNRVNPAHFELDGNATLRLSGQAAKGDEPERLTAEVEIGSIDMQLGKVEGVRGRSLLRLEHAVGSGKIEIRPSHLELGGLQVQFNGAFGPEPEAENNRAGTGYRFEVLTSSATSMPTESSGPQLSFGARIAGRFLADQQRIQFSGLDVKTATGELYGQGSMGFGNGSPEMIFMLRIPHMPVADAKHLWPIDVADGAREWVLKNLFGGTLTDSRIDISLAGGRFNGPGLPPPLMRDEIKADFNISDTRFDVIGELPPVRDVDGTISVRGAHATINLQKGVAYTADNRQATVTDGTLIIPWGPQRPVIADLDLTVSGEAAAIAEIAGKKPIDILKNIPFKPKDVTGDVSSRVKVAFAVSKGAPPGTLKWNADIGFSGLAISQRVGGSMVSEATGNIKIDQAAAIITADARLDGVPAKISMTEPVDRSGPVKQDQKIRLEIDDKSRGRILPDLDGVLSGPLIVDLGMKEGDKRHVQADLSKTQISLPWLGWRKGSGVPAKLTFDLIENGEGNFDIRNLVLTGDTFGAKGGLSIVDGNLQSANFSEMRLNRSDRLSVKAARNSGGYRISVKGTQFDARSLIKQVSDLDKKSVEAERSNVRLVVSAQIDEVSGFHDEKLRNVAVSYEKAGSKVSGMSINALTSSGQSFVATNNDQGDARSISLQSNDAGAVLRFFDFYDKIRGGKITVGLTGQGNGPLSGQIDARDFAIINEPRLAKIVSSTPDSGGTSLNQAVKRNLDVSRVDIERGFSLIEKGEDYLKLSRGVVRGPSVGTTFQGTLYDAKGDMSITGTFMPAYGVNRIFGEVPIFGALLGNGRDRGLLGITFKLEGNAKQPQVIVNPISIIAPGIFRSIFEF